MLQERILVARGLTCHRKIILIKTGIWTTIYLNENLVVFRLREDTGN